MKFRSVINKIIDDQVEDAIEVFDSCFDTIAEIEREIRLVRGNYKSLEKKERSNLIRRADYLVEKNQIVDVLLSAVTKIESLIEEEVNDIDNTELCSRSTDALKFVQNAVKYKGYEIVSQIHSNSCYYYFKAKKNDFVQKDFYVIQVLNWYKIDSNLSKYNQEYLDFFFSPPHPFINLIEFYPGNPSYLIRRYAEGIDLDRLIKRGIKLSLIKALDMLILVSKGLKKLDDVHIFYDNLFPDQIIFNSSYGLNVLPLNIFEDDTDKVTWKNLRDGIKFLSPEQLALAGKKSMGKNLTAISNQYSLGLILFYAITGELLFDGKGLIGLYTDRIDRADTEGQVANFYNCIHKKLLQYGISSDTSEELLNEFRCIYDKLIQKDPADRYRRFEDFIAEAEFLKLHIEREKRDYDEQNLYLVSNSIYQAVTLKENILEEFYADLEQQLASKKSMNEEQRDIMLQYALDYLFTSISNLNEEEYLKEALSCLVRGLHYDFTIEEYDIFFKILKKNVANNVPNWNSGVEEAWDYFIEHSLDTIDTILHVSLEELVE